MLKDFRTQIQALEEAEYLNQTKLKLVPPHIVLINPENQKQYDELISKYQREMIFKKNFLTMPPSYKCSDNLLEEVNEQLFQKPWERLALEHQINRIFIYLNQIQEIHQLSAETVVKLRKQLVNATFRKELLEHQVIYDCQKAEITEIKGIDYQTGVLTILEPDQVCQISQIVAIEQVDINQITTKPLVKIKKPKPIIKARVKI